MKRFLDALLALSFVGIYPRFIEPRRLVVETIHLSVPHLAFSRPLRILFFSDLHYGAHTPSSWLKKISRVVAQQSPDLLLCGGDMLHQAHLEDPARLLEFFAQLHAPLGKFCVLGNHDYAKYIGVDSQGVYAPMDTLSSSRRVWHYVCHSRPTPIQAFSTKLSSVQPHPQLLELLKAAQWRVLHNECVTLVHDHTSFTLTGIGEYMAGKTDPPLVAHPHIALCHNPDALPYLASYPLVLSGHTHGGQVAIAKVRQRFLVTENPQWLRGLYPLARQNLYVSRGLSSGYPFRLGVPPEITCIEIQ